jgi:hypothetical protein
VLSDVVPPVSTAAPIAVGTGDSVPSPAVDAPGVTGDWGVGSAVGVGATVAGAVGIWVGVGSTVAGAVGVGVDVLVGAVPDPEAPPPWCTTVPLTEESSSPSMLIVAVFV